MCIIAAKPAGVKMPDHETLENMWYGNPDGAGLMYAKDGKVVIRKGFMKYVDLLAALEDIGKDVDLTATGVVMHFRITTHGGTRPENTHPFPVTDNIPMLKRTTVGTNLGIAHNGIISTVTPREKDISDTMEYVAAVLAPLKRALPDFYKNDDTLNLIRNTICGSRMAFLDGAGAITTVGTWENDGGILYSNTSYKGWGKYRGKYGYSCWDDFDLPWAGESAVASYAKKGKSKSKGKGKGKNTSKGVSCSRKQLMFIMDADDDAVVCDQNGKGYDSMDYLMDTSGNVYLYDPTIDAAYPCPGYRAYDHEFMALTFNEDSAESMYVFEDFELTT